MLLWILILAGMVLIGAVIWLIVAMSRAERRARRGLYRGLGLPDTTVGFLMERNRDVLAELSFLRRHGDAADSLLLSAAAQRPSHRRPHLRLVQSLREAGGLGSGDGASSDSASSDSGGGSGPPTHH